MKTIEEIMRLIEDYAELSCKLGFRHLTPYEYSCQAAEKSKEIKSALRELVARKPLSDEDAQDIASECASGALLNDFIDAVRLTERAHGIGA